MISKSFFGTTKTGESVDKYTLENKNVKADVLTYGCIIQALKVKNKHGGFTDVTLGYDDLKGYEDNDGYVGAFIGRVGNRIGGGTFSLNGKKYFLNKNDGENTLHGGIEGFNQKVFKAEIQGEKLILTCVSADGEENFPAELQVKVSYSLTQNGLKIEYEAYGDGDTIINLTNHSYFNLSETKVPVYDDYLTIYGEKFTPVDKNLIPTGEFRSVKGTPFDFTNAKRIGEDIGKEDEQLKLAGGYDHNFCIDGTGLRKVATLSNTESGITMTCLSDCEGVQVYSANFLTNRIGKGGVVYDKRSALCLETQNYPDAINKSNFPSPILEKGEVYERTTIYEFNI